MKTIEINLYKFEELSEEAQQNAINKQSDINVDYEWWEGVYEDAKNIGLIITGFVLDYGKIDAKFDDGAEQTAPEILAQHGNTCDTYKLAEQYLGNRTTLIENAPKDENGDFEDEYELDGSLDTLDNDFLTDLKGEYLSILQKEFEYLTSREQIISTIEANEYDFTVEGELY